jgi:hypothetical protein
MTNPNSNAGFEFQSVKGPSSRLHQGGHNLLPGENDLKYLFILNNNFHNSNH